jgi:aminoglycoside 3-N-acetyltransferase
MERMTLRPLEFASPWTAIDVLLSKSQKRWLKPKLLRAQERLVRAFLSYGEPELLGALRRIGVRAGDSVMLHSAFKSTHGFRGSIDQLTNVFLDAVGPGGHLLMVSLPYRSSSLDYLNRGKVFDVRRTPSLMGLISEMFRLRPDVRRSVHPTHPVLAWGPRAGWFVDDHPGCRFPCGPGSPFDKLAADDGQAVFFNVALANFTFFHYLEHLVSDQLPFALYTPDLIDAAVINHDGERRIVRTHVFTADAIRRRRFAVLEDGLRARGLIRSQRVGASRILAVRVRDAIECVTDMARHGVFFYDTSDLGPPSVRPIAPRDVRDPNQ